MESLSSEIFNILKYLLPGFVSAWIFHAFTSYPKPPQFERIIQALIFTLFIQCGVYIIKICLIYMGKIYSIGIWNTTVQLGWSVVTAIILGVIFSYLANNDRFHKKMRDWSLTSESSFHSEWFGTFKSNPWYVVLNLKDGKRIYGYPIEWSSDPSKGHVVLTNPEWIDKDEGKYIKITNVDLIMFSINDIQWVEFCKKTPDEVNDDQD
jgi:hypothetical protein